MLTEVSTRGEKVTDVINGLNKLNISLAKKINLKMRKRKRITESEDNQILMTEDYI